MRVCWCVVKTCGCLRATGAFKREDNDKFDKATEKPIKNFDDESLP
ncbi:hypothetical protein PMAG_a3910 [Pseudoalteromonas mariniglutinosa NCIMB 1770]|nr:hypothetical protein [Pseudoalteromonas mariniglutinosa NCIMB 1770]